MTLKSDAKFQEKIKCVFKYDMKNLVNLPSMTQKCKNFFLMGPFLSRVYKIWG